MTIRICRSARFHHVNGFTLIEAMITVAIVAILGSIALPAYFDYVRRGQLPEAFAALSDFRVKMEQYYQDNRNYGAAQCADVAGGPTWAAGSPTLNYSSKKYFNVTCALTGAGTAAEPLGQKYRLTAAGVAGRAVGHVYTLNSDNAQTTTTFKGAAVTGKNCWLTRNTACDS